MVTTALEFCVLAILIAWLNLRRKHRHRERDLEEAVRARTEDLEREQARESARGRILEMLLSNRSLGCVLDAIANMLRQELPGAHAAILLKQRDGWSVAAAPGLSAGFTDALDRPHAVPFEVWKQPCFFDDVETNPAWRIFTKALGAGLPLAISSRPIGTEMPIGVILLIDGHTNAHGEILASFSRLAQLAIEHSRFYDDLSFQAHHDSLTGLPNRALFDERLHHALASSAERKQSLALLYIDLDRFKQINDTLSHRTGDLLLAEVAHRMRRAVRPSDTVARIGGDEFNILLPEVSNVEEAQEIAERILRSVSEQPLSVEGRSIAVSISVGFAMFPGDASGADELRRRADAAMYGAKGRGRGCVQAFSTRNDAPAQVRMDHELRLALRDRLFKVHYQPKISSGGQFGGLEALARLNHPVHGVISPLQFIPIAEESGLIVPLGAWVLDEVCRQIAEWRRAGMGDLTVAVNVSPLQLARADFAAQVRESIARHGVAPWHLELELTESLMMNGDNMCRAQMGELRAIGVRFALDDFGTGYSSLGYLHRLPVDAIKLDRSFVQCVDTDDAARRLVQAMIGVAQGLGLAVIAEGVETEAQRAVLVAAGCPMMQGYLFAGPLLPAQIPAFLDQVHRTIPLAGSKRMQQPEPSLTM